MGWGVIWGENGYMTGPNRNSFESLNPYLPSGLFHPYQLDESISIFRGG